MSSDVEARGMTLEGLLEDILAKHSQPEDIYEFAALLESVGWNDARAASVFGFDTVFDLAENLFLTRRQATHFQTQTYEEKRAITGSFGSNVRQFLRGIIFALPMLLSTASMLIVHFSLWSYQYLDERSATAIALGTILSFLSVGGFMQAIARRSYFYIYMGYMNMARRATFRFIRVGIYISMTVVVAFYFLDTVFPVLPMDMLSISVAYYLVLNAIWLAVTVMYILNSEIIFTGLLVVGIGCVFLGFKVFHLNIIVAQILGMLTISILGILIVIYLFQREEKKTSLRIRVPLPRTGITVYSVGPFFVYGFLYFLILFVDRVMAWTAHYGFMPYVVWFRGEYEVGLDFALIMLLVPLGVSEILATQFMHRIGNSQQRYAAQDAEVMNRTFMQRYWNGYIVMAIVSILSAGGDYFAVKWVMNHYVASISNQIIMTNITDYVFAFGLISYAILGLALLNAVVMFSLSRPDMVVRPIALAVLTNCTIGFLASRWIHYYDAVWGLLAGAIVFLFLTTRTVRRVILDLDYHLYLLA